ncbi:hypothetical protein D9758_008963 [Tetrapyrgos nigripes]|uniref:Uncharacterized protein n=1 Tax=Tetrapyrgos nigripes TaxID=182062 RepID=A0A8H5GKR8_9AGAR|nr:hypothetical protein D9758_008963 [Tetrapyrgos nigripes]
MVTIALKVVDCILRQLQEQFMQIEFIGKLPSAVPSHAEWGLRCGGQIGSHYWICCTRSYRRTWYFADVTSSLKFLTINVDHPRIFEAAHRTMEVITHKNIPSNIPRHLNEYQQAKALFEHVYESYSQAVPVGLNGVSPREPKKTSSNDKLFESLWNEMPSDSEDESLSDIQGSSSQTSDELE